MKICAHCGEVYPDADRVCRAHGIPLSPWNEGTETQVTGLITDVDGEVVEHERRFEFGSAAGEIRADTPPPALVGPVGSGDTPRVEVLDTTTMRQRAPHGGRVLCERYRLGAHIGIGGFGAVFDAVDLLGDEQVAVKVLSPAAAQSTELITRFHREAIAASRVRHPNIVDVRDFDVDEDGTHFIVMEYLDGVDLSEVLDDEEQLEPRHALAIAHQCAEGLAAAHAVGILHRDLKPSNVFLVGRGESVKIIDFGISKLTRAAGHYSDLTSASRVVGTPCYMSPEQAMGLELDGRCDVYGLGIILFEMLTGERPFSGRSALEILDQHIHSPRVAPSTVRASLAATPGLDDLVLRALAARPRDRFPDMQAFADAIADVLGGTPSVRAPRAPRRVWRPVMIAAAAALAIAAIALWGREDDAVATAPDSAPSVAAPASTAPVPDAGAPSREPVELAAAPPDAAPVADVARADEGVDEAAGDTGEVRRAPRRRVRKRAEPRKPRETNLGIEEW